jgi:hypothetical protein
LISIYRPRLPPSILSIDRFVRVFIRIETVSVVMISRRLASCLAAMASDGSTERDFPRGRGRSRRSDRGQSELVGTVLILGLSMAVIGTSVALGGVALGDLVSTAEANNVENGMSHLSSKLSLVALGDADSQRFSLGLMQEGSVSVQPDAGRITISNVTNDSRTELFDSDLGAIVYSGESRAVAYQGGGIWSKQDGTSRLASPPEYYYRGTTLTFPIIQVTGEGTVGGQPTGRITPVGVATDAVPNVSTPLDNGTIEVKIRSAYYEGWYEYFNQRTDGETLIYHANETVVSRLTVPDEIQLDTAVSTQSEYNPGNGNGNGNGNSADIDGSVEDNVAHRSAKPLIEQQVSDARGSGSGCLNDDGCTLTNGTYFYDGDLTLTNDTKIDTSGGDVTIVVDGTVDLQNHDIRVTDTTDNGVSYYINGSLRATGNAEVGTTSSEPEAERNVFYVADGFLDSSSGTGTINFDAVIYAPDAAVEATGNGQINGALVANSLDGGGSFGIDYDEDLAGTTIELTGAADLLTYLHVSHNTVRVDLN